MRPVDFDIPLEVAQILGDDRVGEGELAGPVVVGTEADHEVLGVRKAEVQFGGHGGRCLFTVADSFPFTASLRAVLRAASSSARPSHMASMPMLAMAVSRTRWRRRPRGRARQWEYPPRRLGKAWWQLGRYRLPRRGRGPCAHARDAYVVHGRHVVIALDTSCDV